MDATGERWIPGKVDQRIEDDHTHRYQFASQYSRNQRVLDVACGAGGGAYLLATKGEAAYVEGVDIAPEAISHASEHYIHQHLQFRVGEIETYSPEHQFDVITCFETIEHVADEMLVLQNLRSWLRPGGMLLISSPNRPITSPGTDTITDRPLNTFHVREFTPNELKQRIRSVGFVCVRTYGQRLRWFFPSGRVEKLLDRIRSAFRIDPNYDSTSVVRPYLLRTPRYFVLVAQA